LILTLLSGCASISIDTPKKKLTASILGGLAAGAVVGAAIAPKGDNSSAWSALGAATGAAAGGLFGTTFFLDNIDYNKMAEESAALQIQLDKYRNQFDPKLVEEGTSLMETPLPADAKKLIRQGSWKKYKLDRWVQDQENPNAYFRQIEMYEFKPPTTGE
jgi:hypothetical protein